MASHQSPHGADPPEVEQDGLLAAPVEGHGHHHAVGGQGGLEGTMVHGSMVHSAMVHGSMVHGPMIHSTVVMVHSTVVHVSMVHCPMVHDRTLKQDTLIEAWKICHLTF